MILITWQYIPFNYGVSFLVLKDVTEFTHYKIAFFSHVYTCIFVLITGAFQFSKNIKEYYSKLHKFFGKIYIFLVLLVAAPSGFIMALYANGGLYSKISFIIQSILWFWFTYQAFSYIKKANWKKHEEFMMRSYALTLSAISLRLFKWIIVSVFELPPMDIYRIVAWLGWVINLLLVEVYLIVRLKNQEKSINKNFINFTL